MVHNPNFKPSKQGEEIYPLKNQEINHDVSCA